MMRVLTLNASACGVALWLTTAVARADVTSCISAHSHGQAERNAGRLQSAKQDFLSCSASECPSEIRSECATFLSEVDGSMASVVFSAIDADGNDATDVRVSVDGQIVLERLGGLATPLDPGRHAILYTWPDGVEQKHTVLVVQGEKNRRIELRREPKKTGEARPATATAVTTGTPTLAYVLGGVGIAALGSFAAFALAGKSAQRDMDACKPYCEQSQADKMRLRYLLADISLGVGLVSLGAGGYLFVTASRAPSGSALNGATLGVRGSF